MRDARAAELAHAFLAESSTRAAVAEPGLGETLVSIVDEGRAAWPDVAVDEVAFVRRLAVLVTAAPRPALTALHGADLYLAFACAVGAAHAAGAFERAFAAKIDTYVARVTRTPVARDEVRQKVREALLVGRGGRPPTIASYTGRGPLGAFVRVTAVRAALRFVHRTRPDALDVDELIGLRSPENDPELELLKRRYAPQLREALVSTLAALTADERNVLRLHYLDGLTLEEVAATYRIGRATAARWLARAREKILAETRSRLKAQLGVHELELDSLMDLTASRVPLSFRRHLT